MKTFVRCGQLFTGREDEAQKDAALVYDEAGELLYAGPEAGAPKRGKSDRVIDHSRHFVMPGLIDVHTHLAYGNAKTEEDIDLYSPLEFRALRGMFFAQKVAAAGYTAICSPGDAGQVSLSIRNAINAGLVRRAAGDGRRPLYYLAPGADRLVPDLDRRALHLDRQAGDDGCGGGRGSPLAGQERRRLHQDRDGRHPAPPGRRADRRLHPGRNRHHRPRDPPHGQKGGGARGRPGGDALFGARRGRPDLPWLRRGRRMHRRDEAERQRAVPDPDPAEERHRVHPAARARGAKRPARGDRKAISDRLRQP